MVIILVALGGIKENATYPGPDTLTAPAMRTKNGENEDFTAKMPTFAAHYLIFKTITRDHEQLRIDGDFYPCAL
jgi:hypothetical protein